MVQWVRLRGPNAGGPGLIPDQGTRSRMPQGRSRVQQLRPGAAKIKTKQKYCNEFFKTDGIISTLGFYQGV